MATHASRNTDETGGKFEYYVEYLCDKAGYNVEEQEIIGLRPHGGAHKVDIILHEDEIDDIRKIVSLKYQEVAGTAEEKIPYEQMCLQDACERYGYNEAIIVLAGPGWAHDDCYIDGGFNTWMNTPNVRVMSYDEFVNTHNL